jgi:acyl-CoA synthetase (AMP-forming)/AMP-acid ligase II
MNAAPREYVTVLESIALTYADRVALVDGDRFITFNGMAYDLNDRAHRLTAAGVEAGDRIAMVAENSADYLVSLFAVLKCGAVPATIYASSGRRDLEYSIVSADPVLVLVDDATADNVREVLPSGMPWASVTRDFDVPTVRRDAEPTPELREPLYLICYSSGTTSRPEGDHAVAGKLVQCHRHVRRRVAPRRERHDRGGSSTGVDVRVGDNHDGHPPTWRHRRRAAARPS